MLHMINDAIAVVNGKALPNIQVYCSCSAGYRLYCDICISMCACDLGHSSLILFHPARGARRK